MTKHILYFRVSTDRQGKSGLGLAAQREAVARHLGDGANVIATYEEAESGKRNDRLQLRAALDHCRRAGAVLVIAKLDRLARSARFLLELIDSGVQIEFADVPQLSGPQGRFMLTSLAAVAELEGALISQRTKDALAAAKRRGKRLGAQPGASPLTAYLREHGNTAALEGKSRAADARAESWRGTIESMLADGMGNCEIARTLNAKGETTVKGGRWTATAVRRLRQRLGLDEATVTTTAKAA
jgi:DNA invertase Pin-like site-specific DNA recombinase